MYFLTVPAEGGYDDDIMRQGVVAVGTVVGGFGPGGKRIGCTGRLCIFPPPPPLLGLLLQHGSMWIYTNCWLLRVILGQGDQCLLKPRRAPGDESPSQGVAKPTLAQMHQRRRI